MLAHRYICMQIDTQTHSYKHSQAQTHRHIYTNTQRHILANIDTRARTQHFPFFFCFHNNQEATKTQPGAGLQWDCALLLRDCWRALCLPPRHPDQTAGQHRWPSLGPTITLRVRILSERDTGTGSLAGPLWSTA